jgi:hypothetical protein
MGSISLKALRWGGRLPCPSKAWASAFRCFRSSAIRCSSSVRSSICIDSLITVSSLDVRLDGWSLLLWAALGGSAKYGKEYGLVLSGRVGVVVDLLDDDRGRWGSIEQDELGDEFMAFDSGDDDDVVVNGKARSIVCARFLLEIQGGEKPRLLLRTGFERVLWLGSTTFTKKKTSDATKTWKQHTVSLNPGVAATLAVRGFL